MEIPLCLSCVGKILLEMLLVGIRLVLWFILNFGRVGFGLEGNFLRKRPNLAIFAFCLTPIHLGERVLT